MPNTRVKSCQNCRLAKARCSLALPCARCSARCLDCLYATSHKADSRPVPRRSIGDSRQLRALRPALATPGDGFGVHDGPGGGTALASYEHHSSGGSVSSVPSSTTLLGDSQSPESAIPRRRSSACPVTDLQGMGESLAGDAGMPDTSAGNMPAYPYQVFMPEWLMEGNVSDKSISQSLSQRFRTISQGSLTAKILLGQITAYPRMMISGHQLPPFIYPPCVVGHNSECPAEDAHSCLPEPLAICASLVQMYYSKTKVTKTFVWQQIYAHARQLYSNVRCHIPPSPIVSSTLLTNFVLVREPGQSNFTAIFPGSINLLSLAIT